MVLLFVITPVFASSSFNTSLKYGSRGSDVREMQEFLIDQGFLTGNVTGNFYSLTLKAVKAFQAKNNLPVSGFWGPASRKVAQTQVDLALSDEEDRITPVTSAPTTTATPVMPAQIQYIYVPTPVQAAPVVDTTAQQRQAIEDEYKLKVSVLNSKISELDTLNENLIPVIIHFNTVYSHTKDTSSFPSIISTNYQREVVTQEFDNMISVGFFGYGFDTSGEIRRRIKEKMASLKNEQANLDVEKLTKLQAVK